MSDVFISYSRKDIAFARLLHSALKDNGLETWIDWQDIPPSADWLAEVYEAIEGSDSFIFIISPTSVDSEICSLEIAHAAKNNKRLIPIVIGDIDAGIVPPKLAALNWIFFKEGDAAFQQASQDLVTAIQVDQAWVKRHTRLQTRALEWGRSKQEGGYLLRGRELVEAEAWLAQAAEKDPQPTALQTQYILVSRSASTRRQRVTLGAVLAGLVLAIALGVVAWTQRNLAVSEGHVRATAEANAIAEANQRATAQAEAVAESHARATAEAEAIDEAWARATAQVEAEEQRDEAQRQSVIALSKSLSMQALAQMEVQPDLAALLSAEAYSLDDNLQTRGALLTVVTSGSEISSRYLHHYSTWVSSVAFSPDGRYLASSGLSGGVKLWDTASGTVVDEGVGGDSRCVAFSPDGKLLAAEATGAIIVWDVTDDGLENLREIAPLRTIGDSIAFNPDGKTIVAAGEDGSITLWDVVGERQIGSPLKGHTGEVDSVTYSPDGRYIASSREDDSVVLWDARNRQLLRHLANPNPSPGDSVGFTGSRNVAFSPDSTVVAAGFSDGTIHLWYTASGQSVREPLAFHQKRVFSVAFSPDGSTLASGCSDDTLILWNLESGQPRYAPFTEHKDAILSLAFSATGGQLATASMDTDIILWELGRGMLPNLHTASILSLAFSPDNQTLASSSEDGSIRFWDAASGQAAGEPITGLEANQVGLVFSPDGSLLASAGGSSTIHILDVQSRSEKDVIISPNTGGITAMAFSPDGTLLASGDWDGKVVLSNVASAQVQGSFQAHSKNIFDLQFSPDGQFVYSASLDDDIHIWDLQQNGSSRFPLTCTGNPGFSMSFSPDAQYLATSSAGPNWNDVILFDSTTGVAVFEPLVGHTEGVLAQVFGAGSEVLASGGVDQTIRLWDVASGQAIGSPLMAHNASITHMAFSQDGKWLASAAGEEAIRLWDMDPQSWHARACLLANRNMTEEEWSFYVGETAYEKTCANLP
jgi:WD40 repeat protein